MRLIVKATSQNGQAKITRKPARFFDRLFFFGKNPTVFPGQCEPQAVAAILDDKNRRRPAWHNLNDPRGHGCMSAIKSSAAQTGPEALPLASRISARRNTSSGAPYWRAIEKSTAASATLMPAIDVAL